ncbi:MAG: hypothetical protein Q7S09_03020 [bacterium]|nr:hypothetical protein [bacterium]
MRRIIATIAVLFFIQIAVAFPAKAEKLRHTTTPATPVWKQVGRQALWLVNWDWKLALGGWTVRFHPGRLDVLGITTLDESRVDIWVRRKQSPESVAGTIVHELAHAFDHKYLTFDMRKAWIAARNLPPDTRWYTPCSGCRDRGLCDDCADYHFGSGDFAECVSWTLQGPAYEFQSLLGPPPNEAQQALIRQWLTELPQAGGK